MLIPNTLRGPIETYTSTMLKKSGFLRPFSKSIHMYARKPNENPATEDLDSKKSLAVTRLFLNFNHGDPYWFSSSSLLTKFTSEVTACSASAPSALM